ncbi:hypothetical protein [Microterricola viridarii]|uniref:Uncharacterized protein n=1 Tax=Microterricola viridarii TaxID=412690 RepID=A0A1H1UUX9_9MICO|nr:hypothetical protein [Microterricola viridarii]SDS75886.1 hypothetical protein SAMN04489834_2091 [Microterricola viridarii]
MSRDNVTQSEENAFVRFFEKVNRQVEKAIGSPPISESGGEEEVPVALRTCPLCGHQMREHVIDESTSNVLVRCPIPEEERRPSPARHDPLGELGMPASAERLEKLAKRD